jgi:hypothetical protein
VDAHQHHRKLAPAWAPIEFDVPAKRGGESWVRFEWVLNKAMAPWFSAHVSTNYNWVAYTAPPLYAIAALQVFNFFVEGLPARDCEKCGRRFVRRREGAGYHWTTGRVKFCSDRCAKAAAQAAYRARKNDERRGRR